LLHFLRAKLDLLCLCAGDFNEVLSVAKHLGMNNREQWKMASFQEVVADCGLLDLGFNVQQYTWDKRKEGDHNVKVRLDRALGDHGFVNSMGGTAVTNLPTVLSDHVVLLIEIKEGTNNGGRKGRHSKPFRYEEMWHKHEHYAEFVNQS
jgi:endonuclease/exonuclease/phosphatase family metal-dependent hydrolase